MPLISVLTTAYNAAPYIGQCIESVQAQTLDDWEMIIVDDASTDATVQVVQRYRDDPRIRLVRNTQNLGPAAGRNRALEAAQGEWIAVLDADDWYEPTRLEQLLHTAQELEVAIIYDFCRWISASTGKPIGVFFSAHMPRPSAPTRLSPAQAVQAHLALQPMIRRSLIMQASLRYREDITLGEDYLFQTLVTIEAGGCGVLPEPLYNYRRHASSTYLRKFFDLSQPQKVYATLFAHPKVRADRALHQALRRDYRRMMLARAYPQFTIALKQRDWRKAWSVYRVYPRVILHMVQKLPAALWRRLRGENTHYDREAFR
jgi:succinoglycan biosynthesis protein ExoO